MKKAVGFAAVFLFVVSSGAAFAAPVENKFDMKIGGYVKLDYAHQSSKLGVPLTVVPPLDTAVAANQDESIFSARQSRLNFSVTGPDFNGAKTSAFVEADFYGAGSNNENADLRMRHAYGLLKWENTQLLFGQFWDIFGPGNMSTVDFRTGALTGAPNNPRVPQVRLTHTFKLSDSNSLMVIAGLQNPVQNYAPNPNAANFSGSMPNVAGQVVFTSKALGVAPGYWGMPMRPLTFGVFGLYGESEIEGADDIDVSGYGAFTFVPVLKSSDGKGRAMTLSFEGQVYGAEGLSVQGATAAMVNANGDAAKGYGGYAQFIFHPTQQLGLTAGYGRRQITDSQDYAATAEKFNDMLYVNAHYDVNPAVRFATEFQRLETELRNGTTGDADIFRVSAMYFF
jgi:hypothetical protein